MSGQRERVLASLFASTARDVGGPRSHHPAEQSELEFLRLAVRWFVAIERDRYENGPIKETA